MKFAASVLLLLALPQAAIAQNEDEEAPITVVASPFLSFDLSDRLTASVTLADIDGDGDLDILAANGRHWAEPDFLHFNMGNGRSLEARPIGVSHRGSYKILAGDLDGDTVPELVVLHDVLPARVHSLTGDQANADGGIISDTGGNIRGGALADFDGDGLLDLFIARRRQDDLFLRGDGAGGFREPEPVGEPEASTIGAHAEDIDGDGDVDLLLARRDGFSSAVALNNGSGAFEFVMPSTPVPNARAMAAGDIDGDGRKDVIICAIDGRNSVWSIGGQSMTMIAEFGEADAGCQGVAAADFDGDGRDDIVVANGETGNALYLSRPAGRFLQVDVEEPVYDTYGVAVGDMNGDGSPDIVFANSGAANSVYLVRRSER